MRRLVLEEQRAREQRERWIMVSIAVGLIAFIPSIVLGVLLWHEVDTRTNANRALVVEVQRHEAEVAKERQAVRRAIRQADVENCQEDELVKARLRKLVAFDPDQTRQTLEQLGIDPDSARGQALIGQARANAQEAQTALAPRDCTSLPDPTNPQAR